jgi:hypothetical protein
VRASTPAAVLGGSGSRLCPLAQASVSPRP